MTPSGNIYDSSGNNNMFELKRDKKYGWIIRRKRGLIMGVANNRSMAWGIAKACAEQGAELAFTYQGDALKKRVGPLAAEVGSTIVEPCDVSYPASIDALFEVLKDKWGLSIFTSMLLGIQINLSFVGAI